MGKCPYLILGAFLSSCMINDKSADISTTSSAGSNAGNSSSSLENIVESSSSMGSKVLPIDSTPLELALPYDSVSTEISAFYSVHSRGIQWGMDSLNYFNDYSNWARYTIRDSTHFYLATTQGYTSQLAKLRWHASYNPNLDSLTVIFDYRIAINDGDFVNYLEPYLFNTLFRVKNPFISPKTKVGFIQLQTVDSSYIRTDGQRVQR